ncbi:MAG: hypothetical protein Q7R81_03095 [Candidatus Peregrinibacteria bacterium]|nr:hypothetical protein [Candidatus Peregrinibacteria bacterium]
MARVPLHSRSARTEQLPVMRTVPHATYNASVLEILLRAGLDLPSETYAAALLHPALEQGVVTVEESEALAGSDAAAMASSLTRDIFYYAAPPAERERRYLESLAIVCGRYPYILHLAMASRMHALESASTLDASQRRCLVKETGELSLPFFRGHLPKSSYAHLRSYSMLLSTLERTLRASAEAN